MHSITRSLWISVRNQCRCRSSNRNLRPIYLSFSKTTFKTGVLITAGVPVLASLLPSNYGDNSDAVASVYGGLRFLRSLGVGLWISVDYYFSMWGLDESNPNYNIMMSKIHTRAANNILNACLENGGAYIKLGQGLVAMSHILPREYITTLKVLQDKCLTRGSDELIRLFHEDFGKSPQDIFKEFNDVPIAAASLAQVYKAETHKNEKVAVKVQYIDLGKRFFKDIYTVRFLLRIAGWMHPDYDFSWIINELEETLSQEIDFINEGKNTEKCAKDLANLKFVYVPKVFWEYTSKRVLVTEFIDGIKISEVDDLKKQGFSLADINNKLFQAFGHQIFQSGFVHADPHPGNILIRKKGNTAELVLLDHGLYQQISDRERTALTQMWRAMVMCDHSKMQKYSNILGVQDYEVFAEILAQAPLKKHNFKLKPKLTEQDLQMIAEVAQKRFDIIMGCLREIPSNLLLVVRNLNTIRAICHDHGNPIDRYSVLARVANQSTRETRSFLRKVASIPQETYYEFKLFCDRFTRWLQNIIMKILVNIGLAPDIRHLMKEVM